MKSRSICLFLIAILSASALQAQNAKADSSAVAATLKELCKVCRSFDFKDPQTIELGVFYKAARFIAYRGEDKARSWKDAANYRKADEKKGVDEVCERINGTINRDTAFKIIKYLTEKESEGNWHVLVVTYNKKGVTKQATFAFLKIGEKFLLGDID